MTRIDDARNDYLAGMKYKEIAQKYGVALSTVKSWKTRYGWQRGQKGMHTKEKSTRTKAPPRVVEELAENDELNDNQKRFCLYYLQRYNATWAYQQAYESSYKVAKVNAWKLMQKPKIKEQLDKLKRQQVRDLYVTANDIVREYLHQATADITDVLDFRTEKRLVWQKIKDDTGPYEDNSGHYRMEPKIDPATGKQAYYYESIVVLKNSKEIDTSAIKSIRIYKGEPVVELYDKQKAMKELLARLDNANQSGLTKIVFDDDLQPDEEVKEDGGEAEPK